MGCWGCLLAVQTAEEALIGAFSAVANARHGRLAWQGLAHPAACFPLSAACRVPPSLQAKKLAEEEGEGGKAAGDKAGASLGEQAVRKELTNLYAALTEGARGVDPEDLKWVLLNCSDQLCCALLAVMRSLPRTASHACLPACLPLLVCTV